MAKNKSRPPVLSSPIPTSSTNGTGAPGKVKKKKQKKTSRGK